MEQRKITHVVAALIWDGHRFLICQRPAHKARGLLWEFVGGKVDPGETAEEALVRECREELDITVAVGDVFMEVLHEYPDLLVRLTLFNATIAQGAPKMLEHNDIRWIAVEEIPDFDFCPADVDVRDANLAVSWYYGNIDLDDAQLIAADATGDGNVWLASGGDWFFDLNDSEQQEAIDLLLKFHHLPHIIEITNDNIKYVIAHADYPGSEYLFGKEIAESELLWPVDRVQKSLNGELQQINGADYFIFGHMMFDNIQTFANQIYIDTGTPKSGRLSFYKIK